MPQKRSSRSRLYILKLLLVYEENKNDDFPTNHPSLDPTLSPSEAEELIELNSNKDFMEKLKNLLSTHDDDGNAISLDDERDTIKLVLNFGDTRAVQLLNKQFDMKKHKFALDAFLRAAAGNRDINILEHVVYSFPFSIDEFSGALCEALRKNRPKNVELLLELGADLSPSSKFFNEINHAIDGNSLECIKILTENGFEVNNNLIRWTAARRSFLVRRCYPFTEYLIKRAAVQEISKGYRIDLSDERNWPDFFCSSLKDCRSELRRALEFEIRYSITAYDILVKNNIKGYVKNSEFIRSFYASDLDRLFPNYGPDMIERFAKAQQRRVLEEEAALGLSRVLHLDVNAFSNVYSSILKYLSTQDLHRLSDLRGDHHTRFDKSIPTLGHHQDTQ